MPSSAASAAAELAEHSANASYCHASNVAAFLLERLPSGELAYLKPEDDEPRYLLTDASRRDLAVERLFGPWPTCAEVAAT